MLIFFYINTLESWGDAVVIFTCLYKQKKEKKKEK